MKERIAYHNEWLMHLTDAETGKLWRKGRTFRMNGGMIHARKSTILKWIDEKERGAGNL